MYSCQEDDEAQPSPLVQKILDILYATEVRVRPIQLLLNHNFRLSFDLYIYFVILQDGFAPPDEIPPEEEEY